MGAIKLIAVVVAMCLGARAQAARLDVSVNETGGIGVADAVVTAVPQGGTALPAAQSPPATRTIDQKDQVFRPYVETFRPGDAVRFHNSDGTRHHVYSFSPLKAFEFVLAPGQTSTPQTLDSTGVIAVGCNIHDQMVTYLYVSDAPWMARTDREGHAQLAGLPAGRYEVRVWHPRLKPRQPDLVTIAVQVGAGETRAVPFRLALLPDPRMQFDRERTRY